MKILIYSSLANNSVGGVQQVILNLAKYFSKSNTLFVVSSYHRKKSLSFKLHTNQRYNGAKEAKKFYMSIPRSLFGFFSFPYSFLVSLYLQMLYVKKLNPDLLNAHFLDDSVYYFYFIQKLTKTPSVVNVHGNELHMFSKNTIYRYFFAGVLNNAKFIIVNTNFMKKELTNLYKIPINKIKVIANGIDKNRFKPKKSTSSYYLYVGRFDKKKGINVLIDAYQKVANKLSKPLYLVGKEGGLSLSDIKQQVKTKKIKIITGKTNKDVVKFYQNAHYSIFPSLYEPFGIVAIESLACGTPFIASSGGFIEINNKTKAGLIFKPKNTKELSQLLIKVDKNNNLRKKLVQKGLKTVKNYYWENIYKDYINLFKKSV